MERIYYKDFKVDKEGIPLLVQERSLCAISDRKVSRLHFKFFDGNTLNHEITDLASRDLLRKGYEDINFKDWMDILNWNVNTEIELWREVKMPLKYEDANMLKHFWEEKGDMGRYTGYDKLLPVLKEEYPLLLEGIDKIKQGEDLVAMVLDKIVEESIDENY